MQLTFPLRVRRNDVTEIDAWDAVETAAKIRSGTISAHECVQAAIDRCLARNPDLNAVIHERFERALEDAVSSELPDGPFRGVPIVVKDLDGPLAGEPFHAGMRFLRDLNFVESDDSYIFRQLKRAGFVIIGKTSTPELGLLGATESDAYGVTRNPWDLQRTPGGSSGGTAAAVAAGIVPLGHGGDGGGSIRLPASMCGLVGLKPSRGRVSMGPLEAENWAGMVSRHVLTRTVRDSAHVLDILSQDIKTDDPYTAPPPVHPFAETDDPKGLRIAVLDVDPTGEIPVDPECAAATERTVSLLEEMGHTVVAGHPKAMEEDALSRLISPIVATWVTYDLEYWGDRMGREITEDDVELHTWGWVEIAKRTPGSVYISAVEQLHAWSRRCKSWWEDFDVLLTPTIAVPPPPAGSVKAASTRESPWSGNAPLTVFTLPFNVTGQPAISLPMHMTGGGVPIGVQLVAAPNREDLLLALSAQIERAVDWPLQFATA